MGTDRTNLRWRTRAAIIVAGATIGLVAATAPTPASAQDAPGTPAKPTPGDLTATDLRPTGGEESPKAITSQVAESDPALVASTSGKPTPVLIKLDYDPLATYDGSLRNLPATSPSVTDVPITRTTATSSPYARHVARTEADIVAAMEAAVPSVDVRQSFRIVYGGVAAVVPANQVKQLVKVDGVVAVQADSLNQLQTEETPQQIGAGPVWSGLGGQATAGNGTLFASLDSGVWPEHPSFADVGTTPAKPLRPDNTPIACAFGDNPLTPANDPFPCNDKLVGGQAFLATYNGVVGGEVYPDTARDSNGHGTHTASTAAGNIVDATLLGTDRGEISGVAPGAWVVSYKVCGAQGCYGSDTTAAVQQAVVDGVDVINYSISGGGDPGTDPTELAFLDAYAAGVFVSASAGNSGPAADTVDHLGPWVTTVAATTPSRSFQATVDYTANGVPGAVTGTSLGAGTGATPSPVVLASAPPYSDPLCNTPAPPGLFTGKIVVCDLSSGRVAKSFNVLQGGAVGMVLVSTAPSATTTDNYWIPTIHLDQASGATLKAAIATGVTTGTLSAGVATTVPGDQIAPFSSRGPRGQVIKPDLAAPGVQVLAGTTPTPESISGGPEGELYMAIPGTSMAAPHVAGAALLLRDRNPGWSPGQIRSALMATAKSGLTKGEDGQPALPRDEGSGRVRIDQAADPGLVLDETAARFASLSLDPLNVVHLNIASVSAPKMPGKVVTTRTFTNTGGTANYHVATEAQPGSTITASPADFTIAAGGTQAVTITITSTHDSGGIEYGAVTLTSPSRPTLRLPVSFDPEPGQVRMEPTGCTPSTIDALASSTCGYAVQNESFGDTTVDLRAEGDATAKVTGADQGATTAGGVATATGVALEGRRLGVPTTAAGASPAGYLPLDAFGTVPAAIGDEQFLNYTVPAYVFNGNTYTTISVSSNGFLVAGGNGSAGDQNCCTLTQIGDPARPNDVMAPYWTDLDGTATPGIYVTVLTDGVNSWIVVEWRVNQFGTSNLKVFQTWIGTNGSQDVSFTYDPARLPGVPLGQDVLIGAENAAGEGVGLPKTTAPTTDLHVTSTAPAPGATLNWNVTAQGIDGGAAEIAAEVSSPILPGSDLATNDLTVNALPLPTVTDPADESVTALESASFTASATGGTLARWEVSTDDGGSWGTVPGASTDTLAFTAHGDQDGNQYRAVYANGTGHEQASQPATLTVTRIATDTQVTVDPVSPVRNQAVTFTADTGKATATGSIQFAVDGTPFGAPVALSGGKATSGAVSNLAAGAHTVTATYAGDVDHVGSDDDADFEVLKIGSDTSVVTITPNPSVVGDDVAIDVKVQPAPSGGNVQLELDGLAVGSPVSLDPTTGKATITVSDLAPGSYTATAVFSGDEDLSGSTSAPVAFTVDQIDTTTEVTVDPASPTRGDDVRFRAEISPTDAPGTVQFQVDGEPFGAPVAVVDGIATSTSTDEIPAGSHTVTATYSGDTDHAGSDDDADFDVAKIETATSIDEVAPHAIVVGDQIVVTVDIDPMPEHGSVQLQLDGVDVGTPSALATDGPIVTIPSGDPGEHELTAAYSGDADHTSSTSDPQTIRVIGGDEAFVRLAYRVVLGRQADEAGAEYWTARLGRGYDRAAFVKDLAESAEGRRRTVRAAYLTTLERDADPAGLAFWSNRLAHGTTPEALTADLLGSNEYYVKAGATPAAFVERLYNTVLGRVGNAGGATYWTSRVTAGNNTTSGRRGIALAFGRSNEVTNVAVTRAGVLACGAGHVVSPADRATMAELWVERGHHPQRLAGTALRISCPPAES